MSAAPLEVRLRMPLVRAFLWSLASFSTITIVTLYTIVYGEISMECILQRAFVSYGICYGVGVYISGGKRSVARKDLNGKVAIVTGANTGLGKLSTQRLAEMGCHVVMACRSVAKGQKALYEIKEKLPNASLEFQELDLANIGSVRSFVEDYIASGQRLDILLNNAGVMMTPFSKTADGIEMQFGTNHIGHFVLTTGLLEILEASEGRIVNVSSLGYWRAPYHGVDLEKVFNEKTYTPGEAYGNSKLANILFTVELDRRMKEKGNNVKAVALHPGVIATELSRHVINGLNPILVAVVKQIISPLLLRNWYQGTETSIHCCVSDDIVGGGWYEDCTLYQPNPRTVNRDAAIKLWELSERIIAQ